MISFPTEEIHGTIGRRFRRVAAAIPDRNAVERRHGPLTFRELDRASDAVASGLASRLGSAEQPVALLLDQMADSLIAALGIFKAAKFAVVLSPGFPTHGLKTIWKDADRPLIITRPALHPLAVEVTESADRCLDIDRLLRPAQGPKGIRPSPDSTAALIYTSGSTGEPKGVIISHEFLLHTTWYNHDRFRISEQDTLALLSPITGVSVAMAFCAILNGAALRPITEPVRQLRQLLQVLQDEKITILSMPSVSVLRQQAESMTGRASLPHLRYVFVGGEELRRRDVELFRKIFPKSIEFSQRYAATETQNISEMRISPELAIPWETIPVGRITPDKELLLLDENHRPVEPGRTGEIAIRSRYLAGGYWRNPELTQTKFLPDPDGGDRRIYLTGDLGRILPDGLLEHVGRKDNFVKVRGFSIQLEAVEKALQKTAGVKDAAAAAIPLPGGDRRLVGYVVRSGGTKLTVAQLRREIGIDLPPHMIPTAYVFLESIPRMANHHIIRNALPAPGTERPDLDTPYVEPRTDPERGLAAVWREIIGIDRVGVDDDFFLLGGDSLLAMQLVLRIEESFHRQVPSNFFARPTIAELLRLWESGPKARPSARARSGSGAALRDWRKRAEKSGDFTRRRHRYLSARFGVGSIPLPVYGLRTAVEYLTLYLSYEQGFRWLSSWCRRPEVIRRCYPSEAQVFRSWVDHLGGCSGPAEEALSVALMVNILWSRKFQARVPFRTEDHFLAALRRSSARFFRDLARIIDRPEPGPFNRWFAVDGLENIREPIQAGRGIILVSFHNPSNRYASAVMPRLLSVDRFPTLSVGHAWRMEYQERSSGGAGRRPAGMLASATMEARRQLQSGGIVQIIPDLGYDTSGGMPLNIARHRYLIKPGFAQLALLADAAVVPHYATRRIDGRLVLHFDPPLESGGGRMDFPGQIGHLLAQYGAFLDRSWKAAPESLRPQLIDAHMHHPPAAE